MATAIDSKEKENPLSRARFDEILAEEVASLPPDASKIFADDGVGVAEQPRHRGERYGIELDFVVARAGARLLLFDNAQDDFAVGELDTGGVSQEIVLGERACLFIRTPAYG